MTVKPGKMFQEDTENGPKGTFEIYRAEGDNLYKNAEYKKAIQSYSTVSYNVV